MELVKSEAEVVNPVLSDGSEAAETKPVPEKSIEEQIKDLEAQLEILDAKRTKSAVEELAFEPEALAAVSKMRAKERFPRAQKEVERHLKQLAWSGETVAYLEPSTPVFNDMLLKWLIGEGFKAKIISLGADKGFKIEVQIRERK
jgi:hypothetical protein